MTKDGYMIDGDDNDHGKTTQQSNNSSWKRGLADIVIHNNKSGGGGCRMGDPLLHSWAHYHHPSRLRLLRQERAEATHVTPPPTATSHEGGGGMTTMATTTTTILLLQLSELCALPDGSH
jgi:hypothetical protein